MSFSVKLDPGHYGKYNRGAHPSYYESVQMWKLTQYLASYLTSNNIIVSLTRDEPSKNVPVYTRGKSSRDYDLFISLHSNGCSTPSVNRVCAIYQLNNECSKQLAVNLASCVSRTMGISKYKTYSRENDQGRDWYGVLRGATAVNTDGIILEHSFHSNYDTCEWLLSNENLERLAKEESKVIIDTLFAFYPERHPKGDIDLDGIVTATDTAAIKSYLTHPTSKPYIFTKQADINGDGKVNIMDYTLARRLQTKGE